MYKIQRNHLRLRITSEVSVFFNINIFLLIYLDDCEANRDGCLYNGACMDVLDSYMCKCVSGFGGRHCQVTRDFCSGTPCSNGGCVNNHANATYKCFCDFPYQLGKKLSYAHFFINSYTYYTTDL